jgi:hypothetical protein
VAIEKIELLVLGEIFAAIDQTFKEGESQEIFGSGSSGSV